jgi:membrane protease YdiL (CAAX protease family)
MKKKYVWIYPFMIIAIGLKIVFTTAMFSISHPLMWGVFSIMNRSSIMIFPLLLMGLIWGFVYWKTRSIKYTAIAHFFVDIFNCSVWVFLNIYLPPNLSDFLK